MVARPLPAAPAPPDRGALWALLPPPALPGPVAALFAAPPEIHPALALSWEIREREQALGGDLPFDEQIALAPRLDAAIAAVDQAEAESRRTLEALQRATPVPARTVPEGF